MSSTSATSALVLHSHSRIFPGHGFTARAVIELAGPDSFHCPRKTFRFAISPLNCRAVFRGRLDRGGTFGRIGPRPTNQPPRAPRTTRGDGIPCSILMARPRLETLKVYYARAESRIGVHGKYPGSSRASS